MGKRKYNRNTTRKVASVCDLSAALVSALKNKKGDAAISAAAEKNKKEDAGLANIGNGLIAPRSQLGFGTVPCGCHVSVHQGHARLATAVARADT